MKNKIHYISFRANLVENPGQAIGDQCKIILSDSNIFVFSEIRNILGVKMGNRIRITIEKVREK
jgi:hypothetical protein